MRKKQKTRFRQKRERESTAAIIDRVLLSPALGADGMRTSVTILEAIVLQLQVKELEGDSHAGRVLLKYGELSKQATDKTVHLEFAKPADPDVVHEDDHDG